MFPGNQSPLSFSKIITGISKSLNIADQIIPIYKKTIPMINNAKSSFSKLKNLNIPNFNTNNINNNVKKNTTNNSSINKPIFFK